MHMVYICFWEVLVMQLGWESRLIMLYPPPPPPRKELDTFILDQFGNKYYDLYSSR